MALQIRRGLQTDLPANPADGELMFATDTGNLYIGDSGTPQIITTAGGSGANRMDQLTDVASISGIANGQVLIWNASSSRFEAGAQTAGGTTTLLGLTDVGSDGTSGQALTTDGAGGFTFTTVSAVGSIADLSDVHSIAGIADGQVLQWNAGNSRFEIATPATYTAYTDADVTTKLATLSGHILPDTDVTYDLGGVGKRFRDLYLSGNTITLGTTTIRETASGEITLGTAVLPSAANGNVATETYVTTAIAALVDTAPGTLDTLNELAAALGDDANYATTTTNAIALKADTSSLSTVATSGLFADLSTRPTITLAGNNLTYDGTTVDLTSVAGAAGAAGATGPAGPAGSAGSAGADGAGLGDVSVTTASAGSAALTYNSGTGVLTFTPPDLSSYLTSETDSQTLSLSGTDLTISGGNTLDVSSLGGSSYNNASVDTHLNQASAATSEVLSWNGSDYDWVAQSGGTSTLLGLTDVGSDGTSGQALTTDGAGNFTFASVGSGGTQNVFSNFAVTGQNTIIAESTTDTLTIAAGSGVTLTTDSGTDTLTIAASGGGGGGASIERFKLNYASNGNLDSITDDTSGISGVTIDSTTSGECSVTFTGYNYPPASIMIYGYDYANNKYYISNVETTMGTREIAGGGSSGSPVAFGGSATPVIKIKLREAETGASRSFGTTTHAWIQMVLHG